MGGGPPRKRELIPYVDGTVYKCSNCNTEMFSVWNYCPHCGAKMDEGETKDELD